MVDARTLAIALVLAATAASGCGAGPSPATDAERRQAAAPQEAMVEAGGVVVRASTVPTARLGAAVARQYGVTRAQDTVLLLVGLRRAAGDDELAVAGRVSATATDLLGRRQAPIVREVRDGDFLDYVATFRVAAPDTLRFEVDVVAEGGQRASLRFNRDFFPAD